MNRRTFFKVWCGAWGWLFLFPIRHANAKNLSLDFEKVKDLREIGKSKTLKIKGKMIMFIRDTETTIRALDPTCTHKKCTVAYDPEKKRIECPCHKSAFDLDGNVLNGPAKDPLRRFAATLDQDKIVFNMEDD